MQQYSSQDKRKALLVHPTQQGCQQRRHLNDQPYLALLNALPLQGFNGDFCNNTSHCQKSIRDPLHPAQTHCHQQPANPSLFLGTGSDPLITHNAG
eukprot:9568691-Ditylum_brightwellii.AAC.1